MPLLRRSDRPRISETPGIPQVLKTQDAFLRKTRRELRRFHREPRTERQKQNTARKIGKWFEEAQGETLNRTKHGIMNNAILGVIKGMKDVKAPKDLWVIAARHRLAPIAFLAEDHEHAATRLAERFQRHLWDELLPQPDGGPDDWKESREWRERMRRITTGHIIPSEKGDRLYTPLTYHALMSGHAIRKSHTEGVIAGAIETGDQWVKVDDHKGPDPICRPHAGKVYRITDRENLPPYHPNCRHTIEKTTPPEPTPRRRKTDRP